MTIGRGAFAVLCYSTLMRTIHALLLFVAACGSSPDPNEPPCGTSPTDWCAAPPGDPCGQHKNVTSCKADVRCFGMPYLGESVVRCEFDERGFGTNCPTVGCKSPPK